MSSQIDQDAALAARLQREVRQFQREKREMKKKRKKKRKGKGKRKGEKLGGQMNRNNTFCILKKGRFFFLPTYGNVVLPKRNFLRQWVLTLQHLYNHSTINQALTDIHNLVIHRPMLSHIMLTQSSQLPNSDKIEILDSCTSISLLKLLDVCAWLTWWVIPPPFSLFFSLFTYFKLAQWNILDLFYHSQFFAFLWAVSMPYFIIGTLLVVFGYIGAKNYRVGYVYGVKKKSLSRFSLVYSRKKS